VCEGELGGGVRGVRLEHGIRYMGGWEALWRRFGVENCEYRACGRCFGGIGLRFGTTS
jgi:hypothetical protein